MRYSKETEQLFCDKLIELMRVTPFLQIKVKDLVSYAGTCRSTFYNYFDSIYDVLQKVEDDFFAELEREATKHIRMLSIENPSEVAQVFIKTSLEVTAGKKILIHTLLGKNGDSSFQVRLSAYMHRTTKNFWRSSCVILSPVQEELLVEYLSGASFSIIKWYAQNSCAVSKDDIMKVVSVVDKINDIDAPDRLTAASL
jgi:hypothetical protein